MTEDVKAALLKAAEVIESNGWIQNEFYDCSQASSGTPRTKRRVCAAGALNLAILGDPESVAIDYRGDGHLLHLAQSAIEPHLPASVPLAEWNDAEGRTAEEVVALFRRAAEAA